MTSERSAGFTLIELAFVAAILVLLLMASVPRFQQTAGRLRVERSVFGLVQTLRAARERAVAESRVIVWVWDGEAREPRLEAAGPDGRPQPLTEAAGSAPLPASVTVELQRAGVAVDCSCIRFFPDGTSDPATTLAVYDQGRLYTVTVHEATGYACLAAGTAAC